MAVMVCHLREQGYLTLKYVNYFLFSPSPHGTRTSASDFQATLEYIDSLRWRLSLTRHESKGVWGSRAQQIIHIGVMVDSVQMRF